MPAYRGSDAADTLGGSAGADTLTGLNGNDTYIVNHLGDVIVEQAGAGTGIDTIQTSVLDPLLAIYSLEPWANVENLTYTGTLAAQLKGNTLANVIRANSTATVADTLYGAAGDDSLYGFGGNDSLVGGSGADLIDGGVGNDMMVGGTGNDRFVVNAAGDRVFEYSSGGFDTVLTSVAALADLRVAWAPWIEGLTYTGTTATTLWGNARDNLLVSQSASADTLVGGLGRDTLDGGGGTDRLVGGLGDDLYLVDAADAVVESAGEGIDTLAGLQKSLAVTAYATTVENLFWRSATGSALTGNGLDNLMSGFDGNDTVSGGNGNDTLLGGAGRDSVAGGSGDDVLYGGGNPDFAWIVNRRLVADAVADTLNGGAGNDRYLIDSAVDLVVEATNGGTFDVVISAIDNSLGRYANVEALVLQRGSTAWFGQGGTGHDVIVGNEFDNHLNGGAGNDTLSGSVDVGNPLEPASDVLEGAAGNDVLVAFDYGVGFTAPREYSLFGGIGNDVYVVGTAVGQVGGLDTGGTDTAVVLGSASLDQLEGVETIYLYGANAGWDLVARNAIQTVYAAANAGGVWTGGYGFAADATGNDLANTIVGNGRDNQLIGGAGNDTITGGDGDDTLEGGAGTDSLVGGLGDDWFYLDTGDVAVEAANGGYDVLASASISTNAGFGAYANFEGWQYLGAANVTLHRGTTNTSNDFLGGGNGRDTLSGFGGADTLDGGAGNDSLVGGVGEDSLRGNLGNDSLLGGDGNDRAEGGDGADQIAGELGDDTLDGGTGNDTIDGGGNWDRIDGGDGADVLAGGDGRDTLYGGAGDDQLFGQEFNDTLVGGAGNDVISGGSVVVEFSSSGNGDLLWGDAETYYGGEGGGGADLFYFFAGDLQGAANGVSEDGAGSNVFNWLGGATIADFEPGSDLLAIEGALVGNGDTAITGAQVLTSGNFNAAAELVIYRGNVADLFSASQTSFFNPISAAAVDAVVGNASAALAVGSTRLIVVDDGTNSALFVHQSADGNSAVTIDELFLVTVVNGQSTLALADFGLFG